MRRFLFPMILGLGGIAILMYLGFWQVSRLHQKEVLLATINAKLSDAPVDLATLPAPDPLKDRYQAVIATGTTAGQGLMVLSGRKDGGAGYEVIDALTTNAGRRVLVDLGFVPDADRARPHPSRSLTVTGNLDWPKEADRFTPAPDLVANVWFARDVSAMAEKLQTEPVLVVLRTSDPADPTILPTPVDTSGIPNDHLGYAITWFSLAAVWAGMTGYLLWRIRQRTA